MNTLVKRILIGASAVAGLGMVYLFQRDITAFVNTLGLSSYGAFALGRMIRFLLNDIFTILLIYALFPEKKYVYFAILTQLFGMLFFLLPYLGLKYYYPGYNGPLISFLHRLILNPLLLMLLIPAFLYQRQKEAGKL
jgi:exosortase F-associated protein